MSFSSQSDPIIDIGAPGWCWSQLGTGGVGILSHGGSQGRLSLAVPYAVIGQQISVPLAVVNQAGWSAAGAESCLEVTGRTHDDLRWVVRATGLAERAHLPRQPGRAHAREMHPSNGLGYASEVPSDWLVLWTPRVRGFYETGLGS